MSDRLSRIDSLKGTFAGPVHSEKLPEGTDIEPAITETPMIDHGEVLMPLEEVQMPQPPEAIEPDENTVRMNEYRQVRPTMIVPAAERSRRTLLFTYKRWHNRPA